MRTLGYIGDALVGETTASGGTFLVFQLDVPQDGQRPETVSASLDRREAEELRDACNEFLGPTGAA